MEKETLHFIANLTYLFCEHQKIGSSKTRYGMSVRERFLGFIHYISICRYIAAPFSMLMEGSFFFLGSGKQVQSPFCLASSLLRVGSHTCARWRKHVICNFTSCYAGLCFWFLGHSPNAIMKEFNILEWILGTEVVLSWPIKTNADC